MRAPQQMVFSFHRPAVETLESRRLLSAAPITNFVGQYIGSIGFTNGQTQAVTLSVTRQKNRSFSGSFVEDTGVAAVFNGTVAKKGASTFNFHSTNAKPKFTGAANLGFNSLGNTLAGIFIIHTGKVKTTGAFVGVKQ